MPSAEAPKRVVLVTSFPWPDLGGLARVVTLEARELRRRGVEVEVVSFRSRFDPAEALGTGEVPVRRFPYRWVPLVPSFTWQALFAWRASRLLRRVARAPGTVVHAHNTWAALAARLAGLAPRTMLHLHSVSSEDRRIMEAADLPLRTRLVNRVDSRMDLALERRIYNGVPVLLAVSEYEHDDARRKLREPERARLVRNGVDSDHFRPDPALRAATRKRLGVADDEVLVLFLGRFVPKNGPVVLARAVPLANARTRAKTRFVFMGAGTEEPVMREALRGQPNVTFAPPEESKPVYAAADVFVSHVSTAVDGFGLTVVEAMSTGVPTVAGSDRINDIVFAHGKDALLVPKDDPAALAEAVASLVDDPARREALGRAGREKVVRDLSVRAQVDRILDAAASLPSAQP